MATNYEIPPEYPERLHIQTISHCNGRCLFCPYPHVKDKLSHGIMPDALYEKIIDEAAEYKPKRIALLLMNEPLLDKKLPERVAYAKKKLGNASEVTITSNGSVLTQNVIDRLIDAGLDRIKISIEGLTRETYERVMGLDYEKTYAGIDCLVNTIKQRKARNPRVVLSMVDVGYNEKEVRQYKRHWRKKGIKATSVAFENKGGNVDFDVSLHPYGLRDKGRCYRINRCAYIIYNGDVILCCADWMRSVTLGNVGAQTVRDVWQGDRLNEIRENFRLGNHDHLPAICRNCKVTRFGNRSHRNLKGIYNKMLSWFQDQREDKDACDAHDCSD